jgi:hypothetical protein
MQSPQRFELQSEFSVQLSPAFPGQAALSTKSASAIARKAMRAIPACNALRLGFGSMAP